MNYFALPSLLLLAGVVSCAKSVGQGQYGAGSYGGSSGSYGGSSGGGGSSSSYSSGSYGGDSQPSYGQPEYGYANPSPTKYPPAMTHEKNRQTTGYQGNPSAKRYQEKFEGLFDDFPGPKTKQRVYYPGKGYVTMQVPVQQADKYGKGSSASYPGSSYDDSDSYSAPAPAPYRQERPSYSPPKPSYNDDSYSAPAPAPAPSSSYSSNPAREDDDSPFSYMVQGGKSSYQSQKQPTSYSPPAHAYSPPASSYSPAAPAYKPPTPYVPPSYSTYQPQPKPSYQPQPSYQPSYQPPKPSYSSGQYDGLPALKVSLPVGQTKSYISYNDDGVKPYLSPQPGYSSASPADDSFPSGGDGSYSPPAYGASRGGSYSSYNPSGYKPSGGYPSQYPDDSHSASENSESFGGFSNPSASSYSGQSYSPDGLSGSGRGFYDLAEMQEPFQSERTSGPYRR